MQTDHSSSTADAPAGALRGAIVAVAASAATVATIFLLGRATGSVQQHGALVSVAAIAALAGAWFGLRHSPLRAWVLGGIVGTLLAAVVLGGLASQARVVDEQVVQADPAAVTAPGGDGDAQEQPAATGTGDRRARPRGNVLLAKGSFEPLAHAGRGTASLIRTAAGRSVLTLTGFETDAGPDLQVWLVRGNPNTDSDVEADSGHVNLGKLKGTSGNQQYALPTGVDPSQFTHAYVWCRAFSVGFTRARLA